MQKDKSINLFDLCVGILIVLISLIGMLGAVNLPGIYLDAANPDYLAVQILYPQADRVSWAVPNWGFPILGQVYHGVFSAYVMAVVIKIVGSTSVVLLHTVNTIYGIIICLMTYFIMKKMNINKWISALMSICMCCMPAMFLTYRTQFYIELPGIMFMTFSIYMLLIWSDKKEFRYLFLAGFFAGFSIYCYYNLAFMFVAYLIYLIFQMKNKKNEDKLNILLIWGSGVALGIILYVVGYTEIIYIESQHRNIIMLLTLMFYLGWIALMLISTKMNKKIVYICSILATLVFVVYAYINFVPILLSNFGEGASQEKLSLINQVLLQINSVWTYLINMITNRANEWLIFGYTISIKPMLYVYVVIIITCISFVLWIFRSLKKKENNRLNNLRNPLLRIRIFLETLS